MDSEQSIHSNDNDIIDPQLELLEQYVLDIEQNINQDLIQQVLFLISQMNFCEQTLQSRRRKFTALKLRFEGELEKYEMQKDINRISELAYQLKFVNRESLKEELSKQFLEIINEITQIIRKNQCSQNQCSKYKKIVLDATKLIEEFMELPGMKELQILNEQKQQLEQLEQQQSIEGEQQCNQFYDKSTILQESFISQPRKKCSYDESPLIALSNRNTLKKLIKNIEFDQQQKQRKNDNPFSRFFRKIFNGVMYPCTNQNFEASDMNSQLN